MAQAGAAAPVPEAAPAPVSEAAPVPAPAPAFAAAPEAPAAAWQYEAGRGLRHAGLGLTIGGYATAEFEAVAESPSSWRLSHASVFVWWEPVERLKLFGELDQENIVVRRRAPRAGSGRAAANTVERRSSLERLHATWTFDDALALRVGKFLTPVGRWNLVNAGPLVWTTNRPLLTQSAYPRNVTGVMVSGMPAFGGIAVDYSLYGSNGAEWNADPRQDPFAHVRGARVVVMSAGSGWQIGGSYARYEQRRTRGEPRTLQGLDMLWSGHGFEFSAEWLQTSNRRRVRAQPPPGAPRPDRPGMRLDALGVPTRAHYVQGVVPLVADVWAVARVEWIRDELSEAALRQSTLGVVWRPLPALSLKLEHQSSHFRGQNAGRGWAASASVLF